jgi:hypothetical protein
MARRFLLRPRKCLALLSIGILLLSALAWHTAPIKAISHHLWATTTQPNITIKQTKATANEKKQNAIKAKTYASAGWGWTGREWECLKSLWTLESRFDHLADNKRSTAYGIAQRLGETSSNPDIQILKGLRYIGKRYGTPCLSLKHHKRYNWY